MDLKYKMMQFILAHYLIYRFLNLVIIYCIVVLFHRMTYPQIILPLVQVLVPFWATKLA